MCQHFKIRLACFITHICAISWMEIVGHVFFCHQILVEFLYLNSASCLVFTSSVVRCTSQAGSLLAAIRCVAAPACVNGAVSSQRPPLSTPDQLHWCNINEQAICKTLTPLPLFVVVLISERDACTGTERCRVTRAHTLSVFITENLPRISSLYKESHTLVDVIRWAKVIKAFLSNRLHPVHNPGSLSACSDHSFIVYSPFVGPRHSHDACYLIIKS